MIEMAVSLFRNTCDIEDCVGYDKCSPVVKRFVIIIVIMILIIYLIKRFVIIL